MEFVQLSAVRNIGCKDRACDGGRFFLPLKKLAQRLTRRGHGSDAEARHKTGSSVLPRLVGWASCSNPFHGSPNKTPIHRFMLPYHN